VSLRRVRVPTIPRSKRIPFFSVFLMIIIKDYPGGPTISDLNFITGSLFPEGWALHLQ
jgi:hypothetical protein